MHITKNTSMIVALLAALFTVSVLETHVFAQETGSRQHGSPTEAYTASEGKSAGDTAEFVSRYRLAEATAYPGLLPWDGSNDLQRYSLTESLSTSEFASGSHHIDLTRYKLISFKEKEGPYWYSNFDDFGTDHDGIDAEYSVNFFTIDTEGNISGIAGIIMGMLHQPH